MRKNSVSGTLRRTFFYYSLFVFVWLPQGVLSFTRLVLRNKETPWIFNAGLIEVSKTLIMLFLLLNPVLFYWTNVAFCHRKDSNGHDENNDRKVEMNPEKISSTHFDTTFEITRPGNIVPAVRILVNGKEMTEIFV